MLTAYDETQSEDGAPVQEVVREQHGPVWIEKAIRTRTTNAVFATTPGRKHIPTGRDIPSLGEDYCETFTFELEDGSFFSCFALVDGHGSATVFPVADITAEDWQGTPGQAFNEALGNILGDTVQKIVESIHNSSDSSGFNSALTTRLQNLHVDLDAALREAVPDLVEKCGASVAITLWHDTHVWQCNIGSCVTMLFDDETGSVLKVWKSAEELMPTTHADALLVDSLHEGQLQEVVDEDAKRLAHFLKATEAIDGKQRYVVWSPHSAYALASYNSIGDQSHAQQLLKRTHVYSFSLAELEEMSPSGSVALASVTQSVASFLKSEDIGRVLKTAEELTTDSDIYIAAFRKTAAVILAACRQSDDSHDASILLFCLPPPNAYMSDLSADDSVTVLHIASLDLPSPPTERILPGTVIFSPENPFLSEISLIKAKYPPDLLEEVRLRMQAVAQTTKEWSGSEEPKRDITTEVKIEIESSADIQAYLAEVRKVRDSYVNLMKLFDPEEAAAMAEQSAYLADPVQLLKLAELSVSEKNSSASESLQQMDITAEKRSLSVDPSDEISSVQKKQRQSEPLTPSKPANVKTGSNSPSQAMEVSKDAITPIRNPPTSDENVSDDQILTESASAAEPGTREMTSTPRKSTNLSDAQTLTKSASTPKPSNQEITSTPRKLTTDSPGVANAEKRGISEDSDMSGILSSVKKRRLSNIMDSSTSQASPSHQPLSREFIEEQPPSLEVTPVPANEEGSKNVTMEQDESMEQVTPVGEDERMTSTVVDSIEEEAPISRPDSPTSPRAHVDEVKAVLPEDERMDVESPSLDPHPASTNITHPEMVAIPEETDAPNMEAANPIPTTEVVDSTEMQTSVNQEEDKFQADIGESGAHISPEEEHASTPVNNGETTADDRKEQTLPEVVNVQKDDSNDTNTSELLIDILRSPKKTDPIDRAAEESVQQVLVEVMDEMHENLITMTPLIPEQMDLSPVSKDKLTSVQTTTVVESVLVEMSEQVTTHTETQVVVIEQDVLLSQEVGDVNEQPASVNTEEYAIPSILSVTDDSQNIASQLKTQEEDTVESQESNVDSPSIPTPRQSHTSGLPVPSTRNSIGSIIIEGEDFPAGSFSEDEAEDEKVASPRRASEAEALKLVVDEDEMF
ncbi:hypothetical protein DFS34DRAFT_376574 [Phlyctochytrium arcticum]|nr:hypothetical protein DFS34DRAFT_376574 [Phlyctochytrium arcticum]